MGEQTIVQALNAVMLDVKAVGKDGRNKHQNYSFRGIDGVLNAVGPALRAHGVVVMPEQQSIEFGEVLTGEKRTPMAHCIVTVAYTFHGPAGDSLSCTVSGEAFDSGDKSVSKAYSVAFRTALIQALALPTDEPDPDESTYERSARPTPDEEAQQLGFEDAADLKAHHDDIAAQVRALPESVDRGTFKTYQRVHGWPMSAQALSGLQDMIKEAE